MKVKKIFVVVLALVMICALTGCSMQVGHSDSVVGKWNNIDSKVSTGQLIFKDNGTFIMTGLGYEITGKYTVNEDTNKITMTYDNTTYTDLEGNSKDLGKPGYYGGFNQKTNKPTGGVKELTSFTGDYIIYENSNKDYLEILFIDPESTEVVTIGGKEFKGVQYKWRYERSYEG